MKILVCSSSDHKRGAVLDAAERLGFPSPEIQTRETSSGVPNQPLGDDQTLLGALQRAGSGVSGHYVVAIENGVTTRGNGFIDLAYVVVVAPSGQLVVRSSRSVPVPPEIVVKAIVKARDPSQKITCGQLEAERTPGCDHADPHVVWSGEATTRRKLLADAVEEALRAAIHAESQETKVTP